MGKCVQCVLSANLRRRRTRTKMEIEGKNQIHGHWSDGTVFWDKIKTASPVVLLNSHFSLVEISWMVEENEQMHKRT